MGISTGMYDFGGIFGALLVSRLLDRWGVATLAAFFALSCPLIAAIGLHGLSVAGLTAAVFMSGFASSACNWLGRPRGCHLSHGHPGKWCRLVEFGWPVRSNPRSHGRRLAHQPPRLWGVFFLAPVVPMAIARWLLLCSCGCASAAFRAAVLTIQQRLVPVF